jgi:hypothetical protein
MNDNMTVSYTVDAAMAVRNVSDREQYQLSRQEI